MILLILLIVFFIIAVFLLFSPIILIVNTDKQEYCINMLRWFKAQLITGGKTMYIRLNIFSLQFRINSTAKKRAKKDNGTPVKKRKAVNQLNLVTGKMQIRKLTRLLTIKKMEVNLDTGDFPLNARLIPVATYMNRDNIFIDINFNNRNSIEFQANTCLYRILGFVVRIYLINKN